VTSSVSGPTVPSQIDWSGKPLPAAVAPAAPPSVPAPAASLPDPAERARTAARLLQEFLQRNGRDMKFSVDQVTGMTVVRIYNSASGELIRQIPEEVAVRIAELLHEESSRPVVDLRA